jgi:hypothetical protein
MYELRRLPDEHDKREPHLTDSAPDRPTTELRKRDPAGPEASTWRCALDVPFIDPRAQVACRRAPSLPGDPELAAQPRRSPPRKLLRDRPVRIERPGVCFDHAVRGRGEPSVAEERRRGTGWNISVRRRYRTRAGGRCGSSAETCSGKRRDDERRACQEQGRPHVAQVTTASVRALRTYRPLSDPPSEPPGYFGLRQNISFCSHFLIIGAPRFELGTSSPPD